MKYHILNGDALKSQFPTNKIEGEIIICRECLIDGNITGSTLVEFWNNRATFIEQTYGAEPGKYSEHSLPQFQKILELPKGSVINLWFGDDLFCQMNLCFIVYLLNSIGLRKNIYLVKAQRDNWQEFGGMSEEQLVKASENRQLMTPSEFQIMHQSWLAFQENDLAQLKILSLTQMDNFPIFQEVIQAHIDRFPKSSQLGRPQQRLVSIRKKLKTNDFGKIFQQFSKEEGIYGFGDLQVKVMFDALEVSY